MFENPDTGMIGRVPPAGGAATYLKAGTQPAVSPGGKRVAYINARNVHVTATNDSYGQIYRQMRHADGSWDPYLSQVATRDGTFKVPTDSDIALTLTPAGAALMVYTDAAGAWLAQFNDPTQVVGWLSPAAPMRAVAPAGTSAVSISDSPGSPSGNIVYVQTAAQ